MTNNAVQISASLGSSLLTTPAIGASASVQQGFTDGDAASDNYVACAPSTGTALNADIEGDGFLLVVNPSTNTANITLKIDSTVIGVLYPGAPALLPIASGVVVTGVSSSGTVNVGVTVIETDPNE